MNNLFVIISIIVGACIILYGITRTEKNYDMLRYALTTDARIKNKKGFMTAYKINSLIVGFLFFLFGFLVFVKVISERYMGLCFSSIFFLGSLMRLFIQLKYTKKPSKERNI